MRVYTAYKTNLFAHTFAAYPNSSISFSLATLCTCSTAKVVRTYMPTQCGYKVYNMRRQKVRTYMEALPFSPHNSYMRFHLFHQSCRPHTPCTRCACSTKQIRRGE